MFRNIRWGVASLGLAFAAACAHPVAIVPVPSLLDVPPPPPRVVVPPSADIADPPASAPATTPQPVATAPRPPAAPPKPEKPAAATTSVPEVTPPPPPLETTADVSLLEQQTKTLLAKANSDLDRIDKANLSPDARAQYDRARGFAKQAENAMREKNLTYARNMAEKAAALASQLPKTRLTFPTSLSSSATRP